MAEMNVKAPIAFKPDDLRCLVGAMELQERAEGIVFGLLLHTPWPPLGSLPITAFFFPS